MADDLRARAGHHGARGPGAAADPRTTVAVITRDRRESLLRTLGHLAALPERPPVIVVDNGSADGTPAAVRAHPVGATLLSPGRNTGALGRNLAARHARTPYVAFSDDDSWWAPGALRRAADALDAHPRLGLLAARTLVGPEHAEDPINAVLARSPLPPDGRLPGPRVLGFLACASVGRRTALGESGGYHPLLFFGGEERLLAYDLRVRGWEVCYVPSVVAHHHPCSTGRSGRPPVIWRNAVLTARLRRPLGLAVRHTAALVTGAARGDRGDLLALRGTLARLPAALAQRRPLPAEVEQLARLPDGPTAPTGDGAAP